MRILLVAYEFPPSPSPQSLRWTYLARELCLLGHDIHVLTADLGGETPGLPELPPGVRIHRSYPGPIRGTLAMLRKRRHRKNIGVNADQAPSASSVDHSAAIRPPRNWKQDVSETIQSIAQHLLFPDIRGEWKPFGRRALKRLLDTVPPDVIISSHEPATTIELARIAKARGILWVADIGDPVLASYTPPRWRRRARLVERAMCGEADLLTVTTEATAALMRSRYARCAEVLVIPQGYDGTRTARPVTGLFDPHRLELLYTGSFYSFRRPDALISALSRVPGARLTIASITVPESVLAAARSHPEQIRLLGFRPHDAILDIQRSADVLVNISNDDMTQIPGKVNEYLGAGRPILDLGPGDSPVAKEVRLLARGWNCDNEEATIGSLLSVLAEHKRSGELGADLDLTMNRVDMLSWAALAQRLDRVLRATFQPR